MEQTDIVKGAVKSPRHAFTSSCFLWNFIRLVGVKPYVKKDHRLSKKHDHLFLKHDRLF